MLPPGISLDLDEFIKMTYSTDHNFLHVTSKRLLIHEKSINMLNLQSIPYTDIKTVWLHKVKSINYEEPGVLLQLSTQEAPVMLYMDCFLENFTNPSSDSKEFVRRFEMIPRRICSAMKIPFMAPQHLELKENTSIKVKGVVVRVYPKSNLVWPAQCVSCMQPVENGTGKFDEIVMTSQQGSDNSSLFSINKFAVRGTVRFKMPYCPACHSARFGFFKKNRAVNSFGYDGISAWFDFENREYADLFIGMNQGLDDLATLT